MNNTIHRILGCLLFFLHHHHHHLDAFTPDSSSSSLCAVENVQDTKRRQTCQKIILALGTLTPTNAAAATTELASRINDNTPPSYGMEGADIYYPTWFEGKWNVQSSCTAVEAPCGVALFGGAWESARRELNDPPLVYEARFLRNDRSIVVADREFNVRSMAQAVMGPQSVLDIPLATPNKLSCILAPAGAPSVLRVDLITLNRKQETPATNQFDCSEVAREIIAGRTTTVLKEIETISLYSYDPDTQQIHCRQRSAKFLLPSQQDPTALRMWQMTGGRPVDVRFYDVSYKRI